MTANLYWKNIIKNLTNKNKASWAGHVLPSNIEVIDEILSIVDREIFIKNCLLCYSVDFAAQPGLN